GRPHLSDRLGSRVRQRLRQHRPLHVARPRSVHVRARRRQLRGRTLGRPPLPRRAGRPAARIWIRRGGHRRSRARDLSAAAPARRALGHHLPLPARSPPFLPPHPPSPSPPLPPP